MLIQSQAASRIPDLEEVCQLASELGVPRPTNKDVFNTWFSTLHEIAHFAIKPLWYRQYAEVIKWSGNHDHCAPVIPDLYMLADPTPDEDCARLWSIQVCELKGWTNPVVADPGLFGGSSFNPRQWYVDKPAKLNRWLSAFGVEVFEGKLISNQDDVRLPYPEGIELDEILANHDHIHRCFGVNCRASQYSTAHLVFLNYLSKQLKNRVSVYA
jgi:hypothetical protein